MGISQLYDTRTAQQQTNISIMQITDNIREKLVPHLKKGWRLEVADRAGVHRNTVTNVFNGHTRNDYVAKVILTYVEEQKARQAELEAKVDDITGIHTTNMGGDPAPDNSQLPEK